MSEIYFWQHIYTSSRKVREYGTYFVSSGLAEKTHFVERLEKIGNYTHPQKLSSSPDVAGRDKYPIAFIHDKVDGHSIFCKSSYIGRDKHSRMGRMGNFIAHSWIQQSNESLPIWALVEDSRWRQQLDDAETEPISEAITWTFDEASSLVGMMSKLRLFVEKPTNKEKLYQLIDCVLENKRVLITDHSESLLEWIQLLTFVFPKHLVQNLTFSSYQCYPLKTMYQVVGITFDNQYDAEALRNAGFQLLHGNVTSKYLYTTWFVDEILLKGDIQRYQTFFEYPYLLRETRISAQLDELTAEFKDFHTFQQQRTQIRLEDVVAILARYGHLRPTVERLLLENNLYVYYEWAKKKLEEDLFIFATFQGYFWKLPAEQQLDYLFYFCGEDVNIVKNDAFIAFLNQYFANIADTPKKALLNYLLQPLQGWDYDLFYKFLVDHKSLIKSNEQIAKIQSDFITEYYQDYPIKINKYWYSLIQSLDKNNFNLIEKNNSYYAYHSEMERVFQELKQFKLKGLVTLLTTWGDDDTFLKMFRKVKVPLMAQLNPVNKNSTDISKQSDAIRFLLDSPHTQDSIPKMLKAIMAVIDNDFDGLAALALTIQEQQLLEKKFESDKEKLSEISKNLLKIAVSAADPLLAYEVVNHFLKESKKLEPADKLKMARLYLNELAKPKSQLYNYHFFRYVQILYNNKIEYKNEHQNLMAGHLEFLKKYLDEILNKPAAFPFEVPLATEIERTIRNFCERLSLDPKNYIISQQYDKDTAMLIAEDDIGKAYGNAVNLSKFYQRTNNYEGFLKTIYEGKFFKPDWTYGDWLRFIGTFDLRATENRGFNLNKSISTTITLLFSEINREKLIQEKIFDSLLLQEYALAILSLCTQYPIYYDILKAALKDHNRGDHNVKSIFHSDCLAHFKHILNFYRGDTIFNQFKTEIESKHTK
jgi:GTPase-associated protein 1, N-terminal domain type 2/GTPase-associated protein 1, middle domain